MKAPDFTLKTADGDKTLADYAGQNLVLYFYPKDMTSGCTTQAQNFRDLKDAFAAAEYMIDILKTDAPFWKKEGTHWVTAKGSDQDKANSWLNVDKSDQTSHSRKDIKSNND